MKNFHRYGALLMLVSFYPSFQQRKAHFHHRKNAASVMDYQAQIGAIFKGPFISRPKDYIGQCAALNMPLKFIAARQLPLGSRCAPIFN